LDDASVTLDSLGGKQWASDFHIWTLVWSENKMQIFVDDFLLNEIDINNTNNKSDGKNPFRQAHYVLLNLAMG
jgi:Glycosyl hydrolases family 16